MRFVQRTKKSANIDEPASEIYNFLNNQNYDYFLQVNACMHSFKNRDDNRFFKKM